MKILIGFCVALIFQAGSCHMPTVYEFCSHVVANGTPSQLTCDSSQCQGSPGKRGPVGPRGLRGEQGQKGEEGTAVYLEKRITELEEALLKANKVLNILPKSAYCYMGMRNRDIPDSAITASSIYNNDHNSYDGRLDNRRKHGDIGVWVPKPSRVGEWLQVDFGKSKLVGGIITHGYETGSEWVRSFKITFGESSSAQTTITENGSDKVFTGNTDSKTKVINMFPEPISCRFIRVYPQTYHNHMSMRIEFIKGECYELYT